MSDEIIKELWRVKDAIAKRHGYSIKAIGADLMRRQQRRENAVGDKPTRPRRQSASLPRTAAATRRFVTHASRKGPSQDNPNHHDLT